MRPSRAREKILTAATRLFDSYGIKGVSADRIIEEADISKPTFYTHFPQKADLIAAYLQAQDSKWFNRLSLIEGMTELSPQERLLKIFDVLGQWFSEPDFKGCAFIKGLADPEVQANQGARECLNNHFAQTRKMVSSIAYEISASSGEELTEEAMLLICGSMVSAQQCGSATPADTAKKLFTNTLSKFQNN